MHPRTLLALRPTLRGVVVAAVAAASLWMAASFGARALNAVVVPAVVVLLGAALSLLALDRPTLTRSSPKSGFPGDERTVTLTFDTEDPFVGVVDDDLPDGVDGDATVETLVGEEPVSYDVTYRARGVHEVGPVRVRARDVLGLAERAFAWDDRSVALVYPRVHPLSGAVVSRLEAGLDERPDADRDEFDHLREYVHGDSLRDIHWKTSARRDDLVVQSFRADRETPTVSIAASADPGRADAMAEATASVGAAFLADGISVVVSTPGGRVEASPGDRARLLEHLASVESGPAATDGADVTIHAGDDTEVAVGGERLSFDRLRDGLVAPQEVVAA
ncbi:MAG: DUF58 domain-containing protein [Haloferacaceae archaeon]